MANKSKNTKSNGVSRRKDVQTEVVPASRKRRKFTAQYKLQILEEVDACSEPGEVGALLRRENLYSSQLTKWRRQRREGMLKALEQRRGPKPSASPEVRDELERLRRENQKLQERLKKAEIIIDVQKKVSALLGVTPYEEESNDKN